MQWCGRGPRLTIFEVRVGGVSGRVRVATIHSPEGKHAMNPLVSKSEQSDDLAVPEPLLFQRREYLEALGADADTTSCQKTSNPDDYGPDD